MTEKRKGKCQMKKLKMIGMLFVMLFLVGILPTKAHAEGWVQEENGSWYYLTNAGTSTGGGNAPGSSNGSVTAPGTSGNNNNNSNNNNPSAETVSSSK